MSYNSIIDNYYDLVSVDRKYFENWLNLYGTECKLLIPRVEEVSRMQDIYTAYGDHTYASNPINYETSTIYLAIQPQDFGRLENDADAQIQVISPVILDDGYLVEFRRLNKWYTMEVRNPVEVFWGMYCRATLYLNRVRESSTDVESVPSDEARRSRT